MGMDMEELNEQWQKYLKKIYWPDVAKHEAPCDFARQITFHIKERNFINNSGEISPQGDRIAYLSDKSGYFDIYIVSTINGARKIKLVSGQRSGRLEELHWLRPGITWSPDGKKIAFAAKSGKQDVLNIVDVKRKKIIHSYKFNLDAVYSPDWSPDGEKIAFAGTRDGSSDIWIYHMKSKRLLNFTQDIFSDLEPKWSPDGNRLVFVSDRSEYVDKERFRNNLKMQNLDYHQFDIYLMDVELGTISRVTNTTANEKSPVWSPDGSKLAFVSDVSGISNVYVKNLILKETDGTFEETNLQMYDNSEVENSQHFTQNYQDAMYPITNIVTGLDHLSWEGARLAFTSFYNGGFDIYLIVHPLKIKPGQNYPTLINLMKEELQINSRTQSFENQISLENEESATIPPNNSIQNYVFGKEFKKGHSICDYEPEPELFLNPSD